MPVYPSVEHFHGAGVERITRRGDKFNILFENKGRIVIDGQPSGAEIRGLALTSTEQTGESVILHFGDDNYPHRATIEVTNGKYKVGHPALHGGELFDPHNLPAEPAPEPA